MGWGQLHIAKYLRLIPEAQEWLVGSNRYVLRLYDDAGDLVALSETLDDLRTRPARRAKANKERAAKILRTAVIACERVVDRATLPGLLKDILAERGSS